MKIYHQIPEHSAYFNVNNYVKVYPSYSILFMYKQTQKKLSPNLELDDKFKTTKTKNKTQNLDSIERSLRRTKTIISDLVLCNQFELFCTFTFSQNRENINLSKTKMHNWLKSQQKTHGKFTYLIVPEFHKDKKAIHFHALLNNYKGKLTNSKKHLNGRKVYNINSYRSGFSSAVYIDNHQKVSSYIKKYIVKDMPMFQNKKRFWTSKYLIRPKVIHNIDTDIIKTEVEKTPIYENNLFTMHKINGTFKGQ